MVYSQMKDYFLILKDKYGSPYFTDDEIALFLNRAQIDDIVSLFPIDGNKINVELNHNTMARIEPLLFTVPQTMTSGGLVSKATVASSLSPATGIIRLLAVAYTNGKPAKATRYNNWFTYLHNIFKSPTVNNPRYIETATTWGFLPIDETSQVIFYGVRYPITLLADGSVNCELPEFTHNDIVSRALELAGVGSRDQMLSELKKLNQV